MKTTRGRVRHENHIGRKTPGGAVRKRAKGFDKEKTTVFAKKTRFKVKRMERALESPTGRAEKNCLGSGRCTNWTPLWRLKRKRRSPF